MIANPPTSQNKKMKKRKKKTIVINHFILKFLCLISFFDRISQVTKVADNILRCRAMVKDIYVK
jgi:hypothetical protein